MILLASSNVNIPYSKICHLNFQVVNKKMVYVYVHFISFVSNANQPVEHMIAILS